MSYYFNALPKVVGFLRYSGLHANPVFGVFVLEFSAFMAELKLPNKLLRVR